MILWHSEFLARLSWSGLTALRRSNPDSERYHFHILQVQRSRRRDSIMASFGILCLGTRTDAETWRTGAVKLGFEDNGASITGPSPTMDKLRKFFGTSADWVFFGGHFIDHLYNDRETIHVYLNSDEIKLKVDGETETIKRTDGSNFKLRPKVIFLCGCSVLHRAGQINPGAVQ